MKQRFQLFNTQYGETVHLVEMDIELVQPEAGIVDPSSLTLRPLKGGGVWTLIPLETDHRTVALRRLHQVYNKVTTEPIGVPSGMFARMDSLFDAVGMLFKSIEYIIVENKGDMQDLINPPNDVDFKPKTIKHNILGDMLDEIITQDEQD